MADFIRIGEPVNNRQKYISVDKTRRERYTVSVPVNQADKFEKWNEEYNKRANFKDIDKAAYQNMKKEKYIKAKIIGGAISGAVVGGGIPLALSLKFLKGTKKYVIGGISALICGAIGYLAGGFSAIVHFANKAIQNTPQMKEFKDFVEKSHTNFDLKIEKVEKLRTQSYKNN